MDPKTYLSFSGGKYRVIHNAMPIGPDTTEAKALATARAHRLTVSDLAWDGDNGRFVPRGKVEP